MSHTSSQFTTTILIVQKDPDLGCRIENRLKEAGLLTLCLSTGAEAITEAQKNKNSLLILDHELPDMSIEQLMEALGKKNLKIPFIVVTPHQDIEAAVQKMKLGARDYLLTGGDFLERLLEVEIAQVGAQGGQCRQSQGQAEFDEPFEHPH